MESFVQNLQTPRHLQNSRFATDLISIDLMLLRDMDRTLLPNVEREERPTSTAPY